MTARCLAVHLACLAAMPWCIPSAAAQSPDTDSIIADALALLELNCATCMGADSADMMRGAEILTEMLESGAVRDTATVIDALQGTFLNLAYAYDRGRESYWLGRRRALAAAWMGARPDEPKAILLYMHAHSARGDARDSLVLRILAIDSLQTDANFMYGWRLLQKGLPEQAGVHLIRGLCHLTPDNRFRAGVTRDLRTEYGYELRCPQR